MATVNIGQVQGTQAAPITLPSAIPASGGGGKNKKAKNGVNQLQQDLINQLFTSIKPGLNNYYQSDFNANVAPNLFNFDPSQAYQGFNGMQAAQASFNPYQYFGQIPSVQAAQANYDPSQWLNKFNTQSVAAQSNFNPNQFNSQQTNDYIANIGFDADALNAIRAKMDAIKGLPQLDPQTQAYLNQITQANQSQIGLQFDESKKALVKDLFGRGMQSSTVALDQGGKLLYGRDQLSQQELANAANRNIDLQKNMRDFGLQNLNSQAATVRDQYQAKGMQAGLAQQGDISRMNASLQNSLANVDSLNQVSLANAANNLNRALAGNQTAAQLSQFNAGNQQQANLANSQMQFDRGNLAAQLMQQIALENAGFNQQANQFNAQADLGIRDQINQYLAQIGLANSNTINQTNQFNTGLNQATDQANLQAMLQQRGQNFDLFNNATSQFFNRKQGNKQINLQQLQLELERQQQEKQLAFQYAQLQQQINAQKGGLFGKIFGAVAPLALNLIPGIGTALSAGLGAAGAFGIGAKKYVR